MQYAQTIHRFQSTAGYNPGVAENANATFNLLVESR